MDEIDESFHVSPTRMLLRNQARRALEAQANRMKKNAAKSQGQEGDLRPGTIGKINISEFDRTKGDATTLTVVVVEKTARGMYRLACKGGVLSRCFDRSYIVVHPNASAELVGLSNEMENWKAQPTLSLRAAAKLKAVAINLRVRCSCQGKCDTRRCSCKRANQLCKSSCHRNNRNCSNHEQ